MLVLVVNNSLTPSLRNDLQLEGPGPAVTVGVKTGGSQVGGPELCV